MANQKKWAYTPKIISNIKISDITKSVIKHKADDFIETCLKPNLIKQPPENNDYNYIVDIFSKWHGRYFYLYSKYACPSPNAISPFFEIGFVRFEYKSEDQFDLSYKRHTEQWSPIEFNLTLEECFETIKINPFLQP